MTLEEEILTVVNQIPAIVERALTEVLILRHPGHGSQKVHGHRHGPTSESGPVEGAKRKFLERAGKLGYGNVQFKEGKGGKIEIHAAGLRGGKMKKTKAYIDEKGRIISGRMMMTESGWGAIK